MYNVISIAIVVKKIQVIIKKTQAKGPVKLILYQAIRHLSGKYQFQLSSLHTSVR
jgi:hypothetical protein